MGFNIGQRANRVEHGDNYILAIGEYFHVFKQWVAKALCGRGGNGDPDRGALILTYPGPEWRNGSADLGRSQHIHRIPDWRSNSGRCDLYLQCPCGRLRGGYPEMGRGELHL
jgi:hypothetical protein